MGASRTGAGAIATAVVLGAISLPASASATPGDEERSCTAVVTPMLSTFRFGATIGLSLGPALVPGIVGTGLGLTGQPELASQVQATLNETVYPQMFAVAGMLQERSIEGLDQLNEALSVLGAGNGQADAGIALFADALDQVADQYGDQIAPADRTLEDVAAAARYFSSDTCSGSGG